MRRGRFISRVLAAILSSLFCAMAGSPAEGEVNLPEFHGPQPFVARAEAANRWTLGSYDVWLLRGNCRLGEAAASVRSDEAALWIDRAEGKVIVYVEGNVLVEDVRGGRPARLSDRAWFGRFYTSGAIDVAAGIVAGKPDVLPEVYQRGMDRRNPRGGDAIHRTAIEPAQYAAPAVGPAVGGPLPPGVRRVRAFPRGDVPVQIASDSNPQTNELVMTISSGVNFIVDGMDAKLDARAAKEFGGSIDVAADRMVVWTRGQRDPNLSAGMAQDERTPLEIYMEGNVVFRQGERVIYASRMYYDVSNQVGTVLDAELLTPAPKYQGLVRLHAQVLQQVSPDRFMAKDAFVTSSRLGVPGYRLQAGSVTYQDIQRPAVDPRTGMVLTNPATGDAKIEHDGLVVADDNVLYLDDVPFFYWPEVATDLREPSFLIRRAEYHSDAVFGQQILTEFNMYQLLGVRKAPEGTDWGLSLNYLSMRGFGYGTSFLYKQDNLFGAPGKSAGLIDFYAIRDNGVDNLGVDRPNLPPDVRYRDRFLLQHRQELGAQIAPSGIPDGYLLTVEGGQISDRNFLQEYYKHEWDDLKDQTTDVELRRMRDSASWNIFASAQTNDFVTQSSWLPRGDHYWLGQSLFGDGPLNLVWFEHSTAGYAVYDVATPPPASTPPDYPFSHLPWEQANHQGARLLSRQELDLPMQLGPVKVVPYVLGELGYWGEDLAGQQLNRAYGQVGVRATLPMWRIDPGVESAMWNVHGLAHKVDFELEFSAASSNRNMQDLPLYDPLNDWNIEAFQRRFVTYTYGVGPFAPPLVAPLPKQVDERLYALRMGMGGWVTAPSMEIADNMEALRLGVHQRWQTKRGPADDMHIIDWIEFNTDVTLYPDPSRDNFNDFAGLLDYNFRWHVGDRLTLVSDGLFDFFDLGQEEVTFGGFLTRPPRGSLYFGVRSLQGPINDTMLAMSYSYLMSPKWISTYAITYDLSDTKNVGQMLRITRVGESLLVSAGFTYDPARNSVGAVFTIEPRFLPKGQLSAVGGAHIPPAGAFGLE